MQLENPHRDPTGWEAMVDLTQQLQLHKGSVVARDREDIEQGFEHSGGGNTKGRGKTLDRSRESSADELGTPRTTKLKERLERSEATGWQGDLGKAMQERDIRLKAG